MAKKVNKKKEEANSEKEIVKERKVKRKQIIKENLDCYRIFFLSSYCFIYF